MLGFTILLLVCEVTISQLCKSLVTLVNGFHTLFLLMHLALPPAAIISPPLSPLDPPASRRVSSSSPLPAVSSIKFVPRTQAATNGSSATDQPSAPQPNHHAASPHPFSTKSSSAALRCGVSYSDGRIQAVGTFLSSLLLASLSISYLLEIISFSLEPHPVQRPLLLVVVGAVSLFHKILALWLNWDQLHEEGAKTCGQSESQSHLEVNHKVQPEEDSKGLAQQGQDQDGVSHPHSAVKNSLFNGALVLCNLSASSIFEPDSETSRQQPEVSLHAEPLRGSQDSEVMSDSADLKAITEVSKETRSVGHLDNQNAFKTTPGHNESPAPAGLLLFVFVIQGLCSALLALINSLVMLVLGPRCRNSPGACSLLVYLDPSLSLLAVIVLITIAAPVVYRYGLLLLQATPPHICVSDLGQRIASVPGVQDVHDLHVWQLTESFTVASVHLFCHDGFPAHRCGDLLLGVTNVLQSAGVSCCTIQPEFASSFGCSAGSGVDACPVIHREDPSQPTNTACRLCCGRKCAQSMCCSLLEEDTINLPAPPPGETKEEPQTLVIENTFLQVSV
ncbi:zinc transporter 1 [Echeneis naucrates]|uniref:zinc transporter 1 n=1 Tax=Echeneis naucrates TaxID=173247 RepID=UPI00111391ED|nr:zinc transporter 1-like [Echeneis naucrates]